METEVQNETSEEKFIRLATARSNKILDGMRLMLNLKASTYKSSQKVRAQFISALRKGLEDLEFGWEGEKISKASFSLGEIQTDPQEN